RVRVASAAQVPAPRLSELAASAIVEQRWVPVERVGVYVPGGKAIYPSSVVMNVVPAQVAGVKNIAIATPPQKNGRPHPTVLATAGLLGIENVFCMGGAAAVAAFAYGINEIDLKPVSLVTGPGNIYVAAAKRALRGVIGIDAEAGTTEILVLADDSANARLIAFDLVSQAEHDEAAASVLVTYSAELANAVNNEIASIASATEHADRVAKALTGQQSAIVLVDDLAAAIDFANHYATEHLELHTSSNEKALLQISNAGAVFMGEYSPVSLGDYLAGSSHVLPTGGQAKFGSGLGVHSFLRAQQVIDYDKTGLQAVAGQIATFADAEGLPAHGEAVQARFK
ncbi:MAG: histidinol dehydrogenase, partial [Rhodoluna sp.]